MTKAERAALVQSAMDERRARFKPRTASKPATAQERWRRRLAVQPQQPHALPGKPRTWKVYWIATNGGPDRCVNDDMGELAAAKVAGTLRDAQSDDTVHVGTYLHGTSTEQAVLTAGWLPMDCNEPDALA